MSSGGEGSKTRTVKCAICGKELRIQGLGIHMKSHSRRAQLQPPSLPGGAVFTQPPSLPGSVTPPAPPPPLQPPLHQPPLHQAQQFDPGPWLALLSSLLQPRREGDMETVLRKKFMEWVDTVFDIPSLMTKGIGKGLEDVMKKMVKDEVDTLREEIKKLREEYERLRGAKERSEGGSGSENPNPKGNPHKNPDNPPEQLYVDYEGALH